MIYKSKYDFVKKIFLFLLAFSCVFGMFAYAQQDSISSGISPWRNMLENSLTNVEKGRLAAAEKYYGKDHPHIADLLYGMGARRFHDFAFCEKIIIAEPFFREALEIYKKEYGAQHIKNVKIMYELSRILFREHALTAADSLFKIMIDIYENNMKDDLTDLKKIKYDYIRRIGLGGLFTDCDLSSVYYYYGELLREMGNFDGAEKYYRKALELREKVFGAGNQDVAWLNEYVGEIMLIKGKYNEAERFIRKAMAIQENAKHAQPYHIGMFTQNLGKLYYNQGKYDESEKAFKRSLEICESVYGPNFGDLVYVINKISILYNTLGRFNDAENYLLRGIKIREELGTTHDLLVENLKNTLAETYYYINRFDDAENLLMDVLNIRTKFLGPVHSDIAKAMHSLGRYYFLRNNYPSADSLFLLALNMYKVTLGEKHPEYIDVLSSLAELTRMEGKFVESEELSKKALALKQEIYGNDHPFLAPALSQLAFLYLDQKKYKEAEPYFLSAVKNYTRQVEKFFPSMNEQEKTKFLNTFNNFFEIFNTFVIKRMKDNPKILAEMYNNQLLLKSLILNSTGRMKSLITNNPDSTLKQKYNSWISLREYLLKLYRLTKTELKQWNVSIDTLQREADELEKELTIKSAGFAENSSTGNRNPNWIDIRHALKSGEASIETIRFRYYDKNLTGKIHYAFLIITPATKNQPEIVILSEGNELEEKFLKDFKEEILSGNLKLNSYNRYFSKLDIILKLNKINKIYFSADGVYNQVNLNTLCLPDGKYVIDEYDIHRVTNTKDLLKYKNNRSGNLNLTARLFGSPNYNLGNEGRQIIEINRTRLNYTANNLFSILRDADMEKINRFGFSNLPGSKLEILDINKLLIKNGWKTKSYTGNDATEESLKAIEKPGILHIATHGMFLENSSKLQERSEVFGFSEERLNENPLLRSMLFLAGAKHTIDQRKKKLLNEKDILNHEDGILTAEEVMDLNLDGTEIVALSACQSGLGIIKNGEGVYGLQRAFLLAGAKSIIMSLWMVNDRVSRLMMKSFYSNWLKSGDKRDAFRKAQIEIRKKYKIPYDWGAFIMTGE
jgi:CHAT domain-containing protein